MSGTPNKRPHEEGGNGSHSHSSVQKYLQDNAVAFSKDNNEDVKVKTRDFYQGAKADKDKSDKRADDKVKHDRNIYLEYKGDVKVDKDGFGGMSTHLNWNDSKKQSRDKKHLEWGERDKERNDRRRNLQLEGSSFENKEIPREDRESNRWENERKDLSKERDKPKDCEKEHIKRELWNEAEKEVSQNEKVIMDVPRRTIELENSTLERKKQKALNNWKNADRDGSTGEGKRYRFGRRES
ncbi:uncharacterized protein LOC132612984 [Lycium barbarum]|uniref:uncharacterized protein LOC132612984 n=1 Tax=Lycium barbarum TaxID=112863 RepID=UPI00293E11FB|nr:uncharacterized protein LOC132612984 [Lycium barbarum]